MGYCWQTLPSSHWILIPEVTNIFIQQGLSRILWRVNFEDYLEACFVLFWSAVGWFCSLLALWFLIDILLVILRYNLCCTSSIIKSANTVSAGIYVSLNSVILQVFLYQLYIHSVISRRYLNIELPDQRDWKSSETLNKDFFFLTLRDSLDLIKVSQYHPESIIKGKLSLSKWMTSVIYPTTNFLTVWWHC